MRNGRHRRRKRSILRVEDGDRQLRNLLLHAMSMYHPARTKRIGRTNLVVFTKAYQSKTNCQHAGMAEKSDCIVGVPELWSGILWKAGAHESCEGSCAERVSSIYCHDDVWGVIELCWRAFRIEMYEDIQ